LYRDGPVESTLRDLLPAELREPRVAALCCTGFLLEEELAELRTLLCKSVVDPDLEGPRVLLDVGCGRGRLGACLAAALGARLVGFDKCRAAIASARAAESGSGACFLLGDFAAIPLPSVFAHAALSLDAVYLAAAPEAALAEVARVLLPGATFCFTAYLSQRPPPGVIGLRRGWEEFFAGTGLEVREKRDWTGRWRAAQHRKHSERWLRRHELLSSLGPAVEPHLSTSAAMLGHSGRPPLIDSIERVLFVTARPGKRK